MFYYPPGITRGPGARNAPDPGDSVPMRSFASDEWAEVRSRGKNAFLLRYGFLGRGLPLGLVIAVAVESLRGGSLPDSLTGAPFLSLLAFCIAVMTATGCLNANFNWNRHERLHAGKR